MSWPSRVWTASFRSALLQCGRGENLHIRRDSRPSIPLEWLDHKRALVPRNRNITFWETWLRFWLSPAILKDAFRCALVSLGVFLGIEIARGDSVQDEVEKDSETGHF